MQRFALHPSWRASIKGAPRTWMSAVDIQRHYLRQVEDHAGSLATWSPKEPFVIRRVLESPPLLVPARQRLTPLLAMHGLEWSQLEALEAARSEMFEIDAKFGALGPDGIFNALEAAGALRHQVGGLDVERAVTEPPQDTRARIRGEGRALLRGALACDGRRLPARISDAVRVRDGELVRATGATRRPKL
jgi:hypothetical protein